MIITTSGSGRRRTTETHCGSSIYWYDQFHCWTANSVHTHTHTFAHTSCTRPHNLSFIRITVQRTWLAHVVTKWLNAVGTTRSKAKARRRKRRRSKTRHFFLATTRELALPESIRNRVKFSDEQRWTARRNTLYIPLWSKNRIFCRQNDDEFSYVKLIYHFIIRRKQWIKDLMRT